jgi:hypothetical protein
VIFCEVDENDDTGGESNQNFGTSSMICSEEPVVRVLQVGNGSARQASNDFHRFSSGD